MEPMMKRIIFLLLLITVSLNAQSNLLKFEESETQPFVMNVTTAAVTISMKGTGLIRVVWGDNSFTDYTLTSTAQNVAHTYSGSATYKVLIYNPRNMTSWSCTDNANYNFNIKELRKTGLTYIHITGSNTITGNVADFKTGLTYISIYGSNTITGNVADFKTGLTVISITGSNTITGYAYPHVWANLINYFYLVINNGTGLSATEVDNLLIDLDGSAWAGSGKTLRLTGSKIAAPTAASAAARTSLGNKGITIITN